MAYRKTDYSFSKLVQDRKALSRIWRFDCRFNKGMRQRERLEKRENNRKSLIENYNRIWELTLDSVE